MIRSVANLQSMAPYALADLGDARATSLAQNESAFPPSPQALAAGAAALAQSTLYPDPDWHGLRAAIAEVHGLDPAAILCGAGSMELIGCLIRAYAAAGDTVLGTQYGYAFVASATAQAGAAYRTAPEPDLRVDTDKVLANLTAETRIVFICNPGNPTGTVIPNTEILGLRRALPDNVLLVVDQAYAELDRQDPKPIFDLVQRGDTVVTRTLSKAYGLAGARVGWGVFPPAIAGEIRKLLNPNNISTASQAMAEAAMRDQAHMADIVSRTTNLREAFSARLRAAGYEVPPSATNFVLIRLADATRTQAADRALRKAGYILRGMAGYDLPDCLRATIGSDHAMAAVADILERMAHG